MLNYLCQGHSNLIVCLIAPAHVFPNVHVIHFIFFPAGLPLFHFFGRKKDETIVSQQEYGHGHSVSSNEIVNGTETMKETLKTN